MLRVSLGLGFWEIVISMELIMLRASLGLGFREFHLGSTHIREAFRRLQAPVTKGTHPPRMRFRV